LITTFPVSPGKRYVAGTNFLSLLSLL